MNFPLGWIPNESNYMYSWERKWFRELGYVGAWSWLEDPVPPHPLDAPRPLSPEEIPQ